MLHRVTTIALNAYRESVRARVLLGLAAVAFAAALYSLIVGAYTLHEAPRVVADLGAMSISLFSVVVAMLIGVTSLHRELEMKTILPLLARPIRRSEYLVGKYAGTMLVVVVFVMANAGFVLMLESAMAGADLAVVLGVAGALIGALAVAAYRSAWARTFGPVPWSVALLVAGIVLCSVAPGERRVILGSAVLTVLEVGIVAAIATFFSSFSTPALSAVLTVCMFAIGRSADSLAKFPVKTFGQQLHDAGVALSKVVPNLHVYVAPRPLLTGEALDADLYGYVGRGAMASLGWALLLLTAAALIFRRRDFI